MKNPTTLMFRVGAILLLSLFVAVPVRADEIPAPLEPWVEWVKGRHPDLQCAKSVSGELACDWVSMLALDLRDGGAVFDLTVSTDKKMNVLLPGGRVQSNDSIWPLKVVVARVEGSSTETTFPVVESQRRPAVELAPGRYKIRGEFQWSSLPRELPVPPGVAIVRVTKGGAPVEGIRPFADGMLYLRTEAPEQEVDRASFKVFRKVRDGRPLTLDTQLELQVSGKARELEIGKILPADALPVDLVSSLPARLAENGVLRIQLRPGNHTVQISSVFSEAVQSIDRVSLSIDGWPSEEVWVWEPNEEFRSAEIEGATPIDAAVGGVPNRWQHLAAFLVKSDSSFAIRETRRGIDAYPPSRLNLQRTLVLDLDGDGFTVVDAISGAFSHALRLNMSNALTLETTSIEGNTQLLTLDPKSQARGVELREETVNLKAISRLEKLPAQIPAVAWESDMDSLAVTLQLPPGFQLLWAQGPDAVSGSWVGDWTLYDLFIVLFAGLAFTKLFGLKSGGLALVTMVLCHNRFNAPFGIWFTLLGLSALLRALPEGAFRGLVNWLYRGSVLALLVLLFPFVVSEIRNGLYPQTSGYAGNVYPMTARSSHYPELSAMPQAFDGAVDKGRNEAVDMRVMEKSVAPAPAMMAAGAEMAQSDAVEEKFLAAKLQEIDPASVVQIGSGVPTWSWSRASLRWNARVKSDETFSLMLLGRKSNLALGLMRVLSVLLLAIPFLKLLGVGSVLPKTGVAATLLMLLVLGRADVVSAQAFPDSTLLSELENRVLKDECQRGCIATQDLHLGLTADEVRIRATVHSKGAQAWPIPGPASEFLPERVLLDGTDSARLRRDATGVVSVRIPAGNHVVEVFGRAPRRSAFTLQFSLSPGHVTAALEGWTADGMLPHGGTVGSIQLTRVSSIGGEKPVASGVENEESRLADYFMLSREFALGVEWRGTIRVTRIGDLSRPATLTVPLLVGERMVGGAGEESAGAVKVAFGRGVGVMTLTTKLEPRDEVVIEAGDGSRFAEQWTFACSSLLECLPRSDLPISQSKSGDSRVVRYDPFPGEKAVIRVVKPVAAPGGTIVIDSASVEYRPSKRETDVTSEFRIRNSKSDTFTFELPDTASVSRVYVDGTERPLERSGRASSITLSPAPDSPHTVIVEWRDSAALQLKGAMPGMKLSGRGVNADIKVHIPEDRWLLAARGPVWGPAILFWGKLIVVLLLSIGIAKARITPLSFAGIVFLGLGLASVSVWEIAFVLLWFAVLHFRKRSVPEKVWVFNLMQVAIVLLSFVALSALFEATRAGLILKPDMQVSGSSSSNSVLRWYVDRFDGALPSVSVYSLPLSVWRGFMLLWSVWLATSLLGWMRWGWQSFSHEGLWRKRIAKKSQDPLL